PYNFFFQAEDGIRDRNVTGVQTCALPIFRDLALVERLEEDRLPRAGLARDHVEPGLEHQLELLDERQVADAERAQHRGPCPTGRSEERRVGKEWRCRWSASDEKNDVG